MVSMVKKNCNSNDCLVYYLFDWDDNILNMSTNIKLENLENGIWVTKSVSSEEFVEIRHYVKDYYNGDVSTWRYINNNPELSYSDFRDTGTRGGNAFLEDTINAIENNDFGPVWYDFIKCLVKGYLFAIVTARGHEPKTIRKTVKWIIYNHLTPQQFELMIQNLKKFNVLFNENIDEMSIDVIIDEYLDSCDFAGISSKWFAKKYNTDSANGTTTPEVYKIMVVKDFINKISDYGTFLNKNIKIGFSDDDITNIQTMRDYFKYQLSKDFPYIDFHTYHTFKDGKYKIT